MKQIFLAALIATTVLIGVTPVQAQSSVYTSQIEGRLVRTQSNSAVYHLGLDGKRHAFPNEKIYFTWYENFSDVEIISEAELTSYPLGKNVRYRAGSTLVKVPDANDVYAIGPWGELYTIDSEFTARSLYGPDWADFVQDLPSAFFFDYSVEGNLDVQNNQPLYPRGTILLAEGQRYLVDQRLDNQYLARPITSTANEVGSLKLLPVQEMVSGLPSQYEIGIPVFTGETFISCVSCSKTQFERTSFETESYLSLNESVAVDLPASWSGSFFSIHGDQEGVMADFQEDSGNAGVQIARYNKDGRSVDVFVNEELMPRANQLSRGLLYFNGISLQNDAWYDLVYPGDAFFVSRIIEDGDYFYEVTLINRFTLFGSYVDQFDIILKTLQIE